LEIGLLTDFFQAFCFIVRLQPAQKFQTLTAGHANECFYHIHRARFADRRYSSAVETLQLFRLNAWRRVTWWVCVDSFSVLIWVCRRPTAN